MSCNEVALVLFATNIANPHHWSINTCFGAFHNVWVYLGPFRYCTKLGAKWAEREQLCKGSCHEAASEFFTMNAPDPHHWTLNSCVSAFSTVSVYMEPFVYCPKLSAKGAEQLQLMQKFVPRSRVGIFCYELNLSAPLDPKLKFSCIL